MQYGLSPDSPGRLPFELLHATSQFPAGSVNQESLLVEGDASCRRTVVVQQSYIPRAKGKSWGEKNHPLQVLAYDSATV